MHLDRKTLRAWPCRPFASACLEHSIDAAVRGLALSLSWARAAVIENASDIVLVVGEDDTIRYASPALHRVLGLELPPSARLLDLVTADEVVSVPAEDVSRVLDTTGAGDLYAAGFLYGYSRSRPLAECARLGSIAAAEVISHVGPRPLVPLRTLVR